MASDLQSTNRISYWDTKDPPRTIRSPPPMQTVSTVPVSPTGNYVVPYSKYNSQVSTQSMIERQQLLQYQQSMYPSQGMGTFQPVQASPKKTSEPGWCARHVSVTRVIGLLLGLIAAGIPLAVIVTLYIQSGTSSSTDSTTASTTTVSYNMPYQCSSYSQNTDNTRLSTYYCYACYCDSFSGWYRFTGSAGSQLITFPVSQGYCGTSFPGWFNGTHPTTVYATNVGTVCVYVNGNICYPGYSISNVPVTNCGGFYVYYLTSFPYCNTRYCTM